MEIQQSFEVPYAADAVWRCFHDTAGIVACLPGAALTGPAQDGRMPLSMTVKLGPIVAAFAGDAQMQLDDAQRAGSVSGGGSDRKSGSRVKGSAWFAVHELPGSAGQGGATRVEVRVEYAIAGSLAQFSRGGIVQELAARLTAAFRDNLQAKLAADQPAAVSTAGAEPGTPAIVAPAAAPGVSATVTPVAAPLPVSPAPVLDLGGLFWSVLLQRLRRFFGLAAR